MSILDVITGKERKIYNQVIQLMDQGNYSALFNMDRYGNFGLNNQKYIDDLNFDITNLKISVSSFDESEASIKEVQERINQEIENSNKSIESKNAQIEQIKNDNIELQKSIDEILQKIEEVKENVNNSNSKIEELKKERTERSEKLAKQDCTIANTETIFNAAEYNPSCS